MYNLNDYLSLFLLMNVMLCVIQPYGVNVPGPVVKFNTVSVNGEHQASSSKFSK